MNKTDQLSPHLRGLDLEFFMRVALREAEQGGLAGELPIGAVLVIDGAIVSRGCSTQKGSRSQLRHAELNALLDGGEALWNGSARAVLFTTVEPCPLCLGAAVMADVPHVIFGLADRNVRSGLTVESHPYVRRHIQTYLGGVLEAECAALFARFDPAGLVYIQNGGPAQGRSEG